ncbi:hypothetical protein HPG69_006860 [Diceros bicornis minor]|uniref:Immunoglobulin V-set domain-containing protein n=1 Tax=Diceros bicornis minor TaxID=77932 RepID=A0A7J7EM04_DICBM|nr:hypothetical protein HPG69_006860 [Diceros bicornis minor]
MWICHPPGKGLEWMGCRNAGGNTAHIPFLKNLISISRDVSKNQFSLQLVFGTLEDTPVYYCARACVSPVTNLPAGRQEALGYRGAQDHQGAFKTHRAQRPDPGAGAERGGKGASCWIRVCSSCYNHILSSHFPEHCNCHQTPPGLAHLLWGTVLSETSNPRACYTVREHADRALPLLMKISPAPTLQLWRGAPALGSPRCSIR